MAEGRILAQMSSVNESLTNEWVWGEKGDNETLLITSLAWFFRARCGSSFCQFSVGVFIFSALLGGAWVKHDRIPFPAHCCANTLRARQGVFKEGCRARAHETPLRTITRTFAARMSAWVQTHFSLSFLLLKAGSLNQKRRPNVPRGIILCSQDKQFKLREVLCRYFLAVVELCQKLLLKSSVNLYSVGMSLCEVPIAQVHQHFKENC